MISGLPEKDLQTLQVVANLFRALQDIEGLRSLVDQAAATIEEYKKFVGIYSTVDAANRLLADADARLEAAKADAAKIVSDAEAARDKMLADVRASTAALAEQAASIEAREAQLAKMEAALAAKADSLDRLGRELDLKQNSLLEREGALNAKEAELRLKAESIKGILGS